MWGWTVGSGGLQGAELTLPKPRGSETALRSRSLTSSASRGAQDVITLVGLILRKQQTAEGSLGT